MAQATPWAQSARIALFLLSSLVLAGAAFAVAAQEVPPEVESKSDEFDVPFVPSATAVLNAMFDFAKVTPDDTVVDLGSGDGRIVITAAQRFGAQGFGVDLNEDLVKIANARAARAGVADRAKFYVRDLFQTDIREATVLTMYLLPDVVMSLRPKLLADLRPGTRIVSHDYHLGDWRPDGARTVDIANNEESVVYYWVVPARLKGRWEWSIHYPGYMAAARTYRLDADQRFQDISGELTVEGWKSRINDATLRGRTVTFSATTEIEDRIVRHDFTGVVNGHEIVGRVRLSGGVQPRTLPWRARRVRGDSN